MTPYDVEGQVLPSGQKDVIGRPARTATVRDAQKRPFFRRLTFLVGLANLSVKLSLHQQHRFFGRKRADSDLNVNKTTKIILDFRGPGHTQRTTEIHNETVDIVHWYKYHGTTSGGWNGIVTEAITKKGHQRLHLLWKLRSFNAEPTILNVFYNSAFWPFLLFAGFTILTLCKETLSSKIIFDRVRTLSLFCDQQILHKVESIFIRSWVCPIWEVWTLAPWALVQITGTQNRQKRKLFCSHSSSTPQKGMISRLNCLNHSPWLYWGSCLIRFECMVCMVPAMCKFVWLMTVVVCVWTWVRSMCVGVRGQEGCLFRCDNLYRGVCFLIQYVQLLLSI